MTVVLSFPRPCRPVTANSRQHWAAKRRQLQPWRQALSVAWVEAGRPTGLPPSVVQITFGVPDRRRRDPSNLMPTQKALLDQLVELSVWPDDDPAWVTERMPLLEVGFTVRVEIAPR